MKNKLITLGTLSLLVSGLQAMTPPTLRSINYTLSAAATNLAHYGLSKESMWADMTKSAFTQWNEAVAQAKSFILNNSKNMMGTVDQDIMAGLKSAEQANANFLGKIQTIRNLSDKNAIQQQKDSLKAITNDISRFTAVLNNTTMMLPGKKDAKEAIIKIGYELNEMIDSIARSRS